MRIKIFKLGRVNLLYLFGLVLLFLIVGCGTLFPGISGLEETSSALSIQQTSLYETSAAFTQNALQQLDTPSHEPSATATIGITATQELNLTPEVTEPAFSQHEFERYLKAAKILLFEDMSASGEIRYVKEAVDRAGYFYLDVGSAKGWFKTQLLSPVSWDLIIAAAEARRSFGGEFFEFIDQRVADGAAAVVEYWDFDFAPIGKSQQFLSRCGVEFQADWYEPDLRVFYWLAPDHPIFNLPNEIPNSLRNAAPKWKGDVGDLLMIKTNAGHPVGDAQILAGTNALWKNDHGLLVSCLGGRVIIQTFSSHEYEYQSVVTLWQNYIYQVLKAKFMQSHPVIPTPAATRSLEKTPQVSITPQENDAPSCEGLLEMRITEPAFLGKNLFEHNALGIFLGIRLEVINVSTFPIQIWDGDYSLEGTVGGKQITIFPDKAATGYLFIESATNLYQDLLEPGEIWRTRLAFDISPEGGDWHLVVQPGIEMDERICRASLPVPLGQ